MKKLQKGFTLIELMIVVAIIAILAAVAAPKFGQQIKKSKDAKALALVGNWRSGLSLYYSEKEDYPAITLGFGTTSTGIGTYVDKTTVTATTGLTAVQGTIQAGTNTQLPAINTINIGYSLTSNGTVTEGAVNIIATGKDTKGSTWSAY